MARRFASFLLIIAFMMLALPVMAEEIVAPDATDDAAAKRGADAAAKTGLRGAASFVKGTASKAGFSITSGATPVTIAGALVNTFLSLIGIIFIILIIYAGFKWMTAGGNEEDVKKAKSTIVNSVIGIVVVMGAWFIYVFIGRIFGI